MSSMLLTGVGNKIGDALLPDGVYWQSGDASAKPPTENQGWTLTTALGDVGVDDTTTRVTSTTATLSVLDVRAAFAIAAWATQCKWEGNLTMAAYEWNGTAWVDLGASAVPALHFIYQDEAADIVGFLETPTSVKQHLLVVTETVTSTDFMSCSDSRIS